MIVRSISGLRFTLEELNYSFIQNYASAFHYYLPSGAIIIGRDGRPSGKQIEKLLCNVFAELDREVVLIGIVPTPTVQLYVESNHAAGGICITASHNPAEWNGLKFLNSDGLFLDENQNQKFWSFLKHTDTPVSHEHKHDATCNRSKCEDNCLNPLQKAAVNEVQADLSIEQHIAKILHLQFIKNEIPTIQKYLKENNVLFVIDAVNASGSVAVSQLLDAFGANYKKLFCDETGIFPHNPEPLPQNLTTLCSCIKEQNAAGTSNCIGIAVDPDADRLVLIDETGNCIGEEKSICLAIDSYFTFNSAAGVPAVVNQSTTMLVDDIAQKHGTKIMRAAVGEINVVKKMQEVNAAIGGEGSGGIILPDCHYGRDSLVGIVLVIMLLAKHDQLLSQYIKQYKDYVMLKTKQNFSGDKLSLYNKILQQYSNENISQIDGIKINFSTGWVHIRTSNTEPIIRIIAEAETSDMANKLIDSIQSVVC